MTVHSASAPERTAQPLISARSVAKSFGGRAVLSDVSLDIAPGEIVSVVGRSGAGKSTLLRLLAGLLTPDVGQVSVMNERATETRRNKMFGLMAQSPALFPWRNVEANVALVQEVNQSNQDVALSPRDALAVVGLSDRAQAMPHELSGGMRQRVAMARALATQAPILLLDEPFSSLDEATRDELYEQVLGIWDDGRHTIVVVTHNITEAVLLSDRVIVLAGEPGRIVETVEISGRRPRLSAIDRGDYGDQITRIRHALRDSE